MLLANIPEENQYDDGVDTFITGEDPNNYIWYSGKLWRAVSVNKEANTTKLVTQWNISAVTYSSGSTDFEGSHMEDWLNDTSVDGFLGNLREPDKFIVTDAVWDATLDDRDLGSIQRPNGTTTVTDAVGLLNMYEYQSSNNGSANGYLNNGLNWWTLTPYSASHVRYVYNDGYDSRSPAGSYSVRPSINLKSSIRIVDGDGTMDNPYRLSGDNDSNLSGTLLNTRYSGEYVRFGNDENNLYRIVSHETEGLTKITSAEPLKSSGEFITSAFGKLAKYTDTNMSSTVSTTTNAKVGLLRFGELMAGQFERSIAKDDYSITGLTTSYWLLTPCSVSDVRYFYNYGHVSFSTSTKAYGIRPSLNLKSSVVITGGLGTKEQPFELDLQ